MTLLVIAPRRFANRSSESLKKKAVPAHVVWIKQGANEAPRDCAETFCLPKQRVAEKESDIGACVMEQTGGQ